MKQVSKIFTKILLAVLFINTFSISALFANSLLNLPQEVVIKSVKNKLWYEGVFRPKNLKTKIGEIGENIYSPDRFPEELKRALNP